MGTYQSSELSNTLTFCGHCSNICFQTRFTGQGYFGTLLISQLLEFLSFANTLSNRTITITGIIVCVFVGLGFLCGGYGINKHDDLAGLICCTVLNMGIITIGTIIILVFAVKGRNLLDVKIQALD